MKHFIKGAALVAMMAPFATPISAETIKMTAASSHPDFLPWVNVMSKHVVPETNKRFEAAGIDLEIQWTEAYSGSLFNAKNALESLEGGLTDIAWVGTIFEPAKMPLQNVHLYAPFAAYDVTLLTEIGNHLHDTLPVMNEQWAKYNQHMLGMHGDGSYQIITKEPINTLEDLKGMKLMAAGAVGSWLDGTGAIPINGGYPDFYNSISTGIADGAVMTVNGMLPFKIHEVAPYITVVNLGGPITGGLAINADSWDALQPEAQQIFTDLGREYSTMVAAQVAAREEKFMATMVEEGAILSELSAEERLRWANALPDLAGDWVKRNEAQGLPAGEVLKAFLDAAKAGGNTPIRNWAGQ